MLFCFQRGLINVDRGDGAFALCLPEAMLFCFQRGSIRVDGEVMAHSHIMLLF